MTDNIMTKIGQMPTEMWNNSRGIQSFSGLAVAVKIILCTYGNKNNPLIKGCTTYFVPGLKGYCSWKKVIQLANDFRGRKEEGKKGEQGYVSSKKAISEKSDWEQAKYSLKMFNALLGVVAGVDKIVGISLWSGMERNNVLGKALDRLGLDGRFYTHGVLSNGKVQLKVLELFISFTEEVSKGKKASKEKLASVGSIIANIATGAHIGDFVKASKYAAPLTLLHSVVLLDMSLIQVRRSGLDAWKAVSVK